MFPIPPSHPTHLTTKTHTRGSHVVLMESPSDGDTAVDDTSDDDGHARGRAPAMPAPYRVPHIVVTKKLQKVQKD
jgi:hypothetical protein